VPLSPLASLVIVTWNRKEDLLETLAHSVEQKAAEIVVVDNASSDGTPEAVAARFPEVKVVTCDRNEGAIARNRGIVASETEFVAFNDDDSFFTSGSLERGVAYLQQFPDVAILAACVLVGEDLHLDPTCETMAHSALGQRPGDPGPEVLGFVGCGFLARREALLQVGGFDATLGGIGSEESLLALDLSAAGWRLVYAPEVVVHHHPSMVRDPRERRRVVARNDLLVAWMRRRPVAALRRTGAIVASSRNDPAARQGVLDAVRQAPRALARRRSVSSSIEKRLRLLESSS
jgi:N-acetylglucosaminyl-diphospho-decaprenol L-rhamnosyltransferase